jgi:hypothetical protein
MIVGSAQCTARLGRFCAQPVINECRRVAAEHFTFCRDVDLP